MTFFATWLRWSFVVALLAAGAVAAAGETAPKKACWDALRLNLTTRQAAVILAPTAGRPLIVTRTKSGSYETWTYDRGGNLLFVGGVLVAWSAPRTPPAAPHKREPQG